MPAYIPDLVFEDVAVSESEPEAEEGVPKSTKEAVDVEMEVEPIETDTKKDDEANKEESQDEGFEFRLFSGPSETAVPSKIIITKDTVEVEEPAIPEGVLYVEMHRPDSYYFTSYTEEAKTQFSEMAVDGYDLLKKFEQQENNHTPIFWGPGNREPKVIQFSDLIAAAKKEHQKVKNRRRPGKKARAVRKERRTAKLEQQKQVQRQRQKESRKFGKGSFQNRKGGVVKKK